MSTLPSVSSPDLLGRGLAVNLRVGRVLELLRHERFRLAAEFLEQLFRLGDRAVHALLARRQHDSPRRTP